MTAPRLFPSTATAFTTGALGFLVDAISCDVTEVLNGSFELELTYPAHGELFDRLTGRALILAKPSPNRAPEPFRIYKSQHRMNGLVSFFARHISYDLSGIPVAPFAATTAAEAMASMKSGSITTNPFTFETDVETSGALGVEVPTGCRALLGGGDNTLLGEFGGQLQYEGYTVRLLQRRGADRGMSLRYGINLVDAAQEKNISDMYTGVLPYAYDRTNETLVTLEPPVISLGTFDHERVLPLDLSGQFSAAPTQAELREMADKFIAEYRYNEPKVSIRVSQPELSAFQGALPEVLELGDTVRVYYRQLGITAAANAVKTVYDALRNRYKSVEIGEVQPTIVRTIAKLEVQVINNTTIISGGGGGGGGGGSAVAVFG